MTQENLYPLRPGEVIVRSERKRLVRDRTFPGHPQPPLNPQSAALEADTPTILTREAAERIAAEHPDLSIEEEGAGTLPKFMDASDTAARAIWRDGRSPERPRGQVIEGLVHRFKLGGSVAEATLLLIDAGWEPEKAADRMRAVYDRAVTERRAYHEPWWTEARRLIQEGQA